MGRCGRIERGRQDAKQIKRHGCPVKWEEAGLRCVRHRPMFCITKKCYATENLQQQHKDNLMVVMVQRGQIDANKE